MKQETVLIIEDDPSILFGLRDTFERVGYQVRTAVDGTLGLQLALSIRPNLILLDLMLPGQNGYQLCQSIRAAELDMPIIMITALGQEEQIIRGLNLGADDYMTKPFSIQELMARASRFLQRRRKNLPDLVEFGEFELDRGSKRLRHKNSWVDLTPKEYGLLDYFIRNIGRAVTRNQILTAVWGDDFIVTDRSVDRAITTLRAKIEPNPHRPRFVQTVPQIGYRFEICPPWKEGLTPT